MTIVPTYECNFHCDFCFFNMYRDKEDKKNLLLDLDAFKEFLDTTDNITDLVVIGGEPFTLPPGYLKRLVDICYNHIQEKIDVYTNFTLPIPPDLDFSKMRLIVSYDPCNRILQSKVLNRMLEFQEDFAIFMIITKELIRDWGAKKVINFANKIKKKIYMCNYELVPGNEWSHRPEPEELAAFTIALAKSENPYFAFKEINAYNKICFEDEKEHRFETHVVMTPQMTFSYQTAGVNKLHRFGNTYEEARKGFHNTYKNNNICLGCEYNDFCGKMYAKNNKCEYDKIVMDLFEEEHRRCADGHHTNLSM